MTEKIQIKEVATEQKQEDLDRENRPKTLWSIVNLKPRIHQPKHEWIRMQIS